MELKNIKIGQSGTIQINFPPQFDLRFTPWRQPEQEPWRQPEQEPSKPEYEPEVNPEWDETFKNSLLELLDHINNPNLPQWHEDWDMNRHSQAKSRPDLDRYFEKPEVHRYRCKQPMYSRAGWKDWIMLAEPSMYENEAEAYQTAFHELGHWAGHESRLDRPSLFRSQFSHYYNGIEEMTAELTGVFVCAAHGLKSDFMNRAAYIKSFWLRNTHGEPEAFIKAIKQARQASYYILNGETTVKAN